MGVVQVGVLLDLIGFDDEQSLVIGDPLTGKNQLMVKHAGLLLSLADDQIVLQPGHEREQEPEGYDKDDPDDQDEFIFEFLEGQIHRSGVNSCALLISWLDNSAMIVCCPPFYHEWTGNYHGFVTSR